MKINELLIRTTGPMAKRAFAFFSVTVVASAAVGISLDNSGTAGAWGFVAAVADVVVALSITIWATALALWIASLLQSVHGRPDQEVSLDGTTAEEPVDLVADVRERLCGNMVAYMKKATIFFGMLFLLSQAVSFLHSSPSGSLGCLIPLTYGISVFSAAVMIATFILVLVFWSQPQKRITASSSD